MNLIFFGTSSFAVPCLKSLTASSHKVLLVVTQPDRRRGRYLHLQPSVVKEVAVSLNIPIFQPANISEKGCLEQLKKMNADLFVVVSFGQMLNNEVLSIPRKFAINLHASLLPKYRGAAPINWAIINGEKKTGVTIFKIEREMDAGDIILDKEVDIQDADNAITLTEKLSHIGAKLLIEAINLIDTGKIVFKKQDKNLVTFAPKLKKEDGLLDWSLSALELHNKVRGLLPWPSAFTYFKGKRLKILETEVLLCKEKCEIYGRVVGVETDRGIVISTREGCLVIKRLQLEGSRPMSVAEFLRGHRLPVGEIFSCKIQGI
ncbi:MAG: methionyl-tRNA formyltransferase [Candidatus Omnitrophica bacterium]|nr:methionyl-tRNA formyltransferase [Candidatus Omnitrophota bacterium]